MIRWAFESARRGHSISWQPHHEAHSTLSNMKKRHILIVDDDQNTLRSIKFVLEAASYKVTAAADSQEALEKIAWARNSCCPVELLISDIQMPGLEGLELIGELNRHKIDLPTLVISAYSNQELHVELVRLGYDNLLIKPFDEEALVGRVTELLEQKNQQQKIN
jgi:two-component system, response regulator FlrC